jgi:hypothetical protein
MSIPTGTKPVPTAWTIGLTLCMVSALLRFRALSVTPFANGWDSYFYLVQLKSWVEQGRMHSPEASLFYPYLRLFQALQGDYVLAFKTAVALLCGLFCWGAWRFGGAGRWVALWLLFSPHLTWFAAQYPKNLFGLVLLMPLLAHCKKWLQGDWPSVWREGWWFAALLLLNFFGHRFTFALGLWAIVCWGGAMAWRQRNDFWRRPVVLRRGIWALAGAIVVFAGVGLAPGLAHISDLGRLSGTFSVTPQFSPLSFVQDYGYERIGAAWLLEIVLAVLAWVWVVRLAFRQSGVGYWPTLTFVSALLFPFLAWSLTGVSFRFCSTFVLIAPLAFFAVQQLPCREAISWKKELLWMGVAGALCAALPQSYDPRRHDPDYAFYAHLTPRITAFLEKQPPAPEPILLIAHNSLAEYFTFVSGVDAMPWRPEYAVDPRALWRIAADIPFDQLRHYADAPNLCLDLHKNYTFLRENAWIAALGAAQEAGDEDFLRAAKTWKNPHRQRPAWLLRRKK